jgi:DNA-binding Lrp family transcriptional regulator
MGARENAKVDAIDRSILNIIQGSFPLDSSPYKLIGLQAGTEETEAFQRVAVLRRKGIIRRLGGVFDPRRLGFISTLCAARVPEAKIPVLAELTRHITEITHNYLRDHHYNVWFTVIASSQERLEQILAKVKLALETEEVYSLPAIKIFKIGVMFNLEEEQGTNQSQSPVLEQIPFANHKFSPTKAIYVPSETEKTIISLLQDNLPNSLKPYADLALKLHMEEEQILTNIRRLLEYKVLRRIGAILYHQNAGYTSNAMGVWIVPEDKINKIGQLMAQFQEVSHCYQRPTLPDWPYNIFTMIHGQADKQCYEIMARIAQATGIKDYRLLFSVIELKKSSMRYY